VASGGRSGRGDPRDPALRLIDEAMRLLELLEDTIGEIAEGARRGEAPSPGSVYRAYTHAVRLRDKLAELRGAINRLPCGDATGKGPGPCRGGAGEVATG